MDMDTRRDQDRQGEEIQFTKHRKRVQVREEGNRNQRGQVKAEI